MKDKFKCYYDYSEKEKAQILKNSTIVLDTCVLINLYEYTSRSREDMFKILDEISNQLWMPHHVALEFNRRRLGAIDKIIRLISSTKEAFSKNMDTFKSQIRKTQSDLGKLAKELDIETVITKVDEGCSGLVSQIDEISEQQNKLLEIDPICNKINDLFSGKIGDGPKDQNELNNMLQEGDKRYKFNIPPGYMDIDKDKNKNDKEGYGYGGIYYQYKYGDLIIWEQLIKKAIDSNIKYLVFVTDDSKEDWWWMLRPKGKKLGPRPELKEEMFRKAKLEGYHQYSADELMKYVSMQYNVSVTEGSIDEVKKIGQRLRLKSDTYRMLDDLPTELMDQIFLWLNGYYPRYHLRQHTHGFPHFILKAKKSGRETGVEVIPFINFEDCLLQLKTAHRQAEFLLSKHPALKETKLKSYIFLVAGFEIDQIEFSRLEKYFLSINENLSLPIRLHFIKIYELGDGRYRIQKLLF